MMALGRVTDAYCLKFIQDNRSGSQKNVQL